MYIGERASIAVNLPGLHSARLGSRLRMRTTSGESALQCRVLPWVVCCTL